MAAVPLPYSQAYQATTIEDLWDYVHLPPAQRISLHRKRVCERPECKEKLPPSRGTFIEKKDRPKNKARKICTNCRDIIYCSDKCYRHDKDRHKIECAHNPSNLLKCVILEDAAGVVALLLKYPKQACKDFGGHFILEWARKVGYEPTISAINNTLNVALKHAIQAKESDTIRLIVAAGATVNDTRKGEADEAMLSVLNDALQKRAEAEQKQTEFKSMYVAKAERDAAKPPEPKGPQTLQEIAQEQVNSAELEDKEAPPAPTTAGPALPPDWAEQAAKRMQKAKDEEDILRQHKLGEKRKEVEKKRGEREAQIERLQADRKRKNAELVAQAQATDQVAEELNKVVIADT